MLVMLVKLRLLWTDDSSVGEDLRTKKSTSIVLPLPFAPFRLRALNDCEIIRSVGLSWRQYR